MEIRVLRYFLTIAREGSITSAAEQLHITQPNLSKHMMELEREIGVELIDRKTYGKNRPVLSEAGKYFFEEMSYIETSIQGTVKRCRALGSSGIRDVRVQEIWQNNAMFKLYSLAGTYQSTHLESTIRYVRLSDKQPIEALLRNDFDMVFDSLTGCGYWVSHRTEPSGDSQLYSFEGALDGVLLWGLVMDKLDNPLPGVQIFVRQGDQVVCSSETDEDGFYHLYLQGDQYYDISYRLDDYFSGYESINTTKEVGEYLIAEARRDLKLEKLPLGERLYYEDLFGPDVDIELSELGRERLEPLVRFLNDNPEMSVDVSLSNDVTTNSRFNTLLTDQRLLTLRNYLFQMVPPTVVIHIHNSCAGIEGCSNASGLSRLVVQINKGEK